MTARSDNLKIIQNLFEDGKTKNACDEMATRRILRMHTESCPPVRQIENIYDQFGLPKKYAYFFMGERNTFVATIYRFRNWW
jgi:hypothetical protein